jgi:hypothetical protein
VTARGFRTLFFIVTGMGVFLGGFWGLPPGYLIDTGLRMPDPAMSGKPVWYFVLFATFYGYLSIVLILVWLAGFGFVAPLVRRGLRKRILAGYFGEDGRKVGVGTFRSLTGLTGEEIRRLYGDGKTGFDLADYRTAARYMKSLGVSVEERLRAESPGSPDRRD